jgi:hypothetical protein
MAITVVPVGTQVLIKVSNMASPEVFAHPCLINLSREIAWSHNYEEDEIPDCDTPANPHAIKRQVRSVDLSVTGSGKLDAAGIAEYVTWSTTGAVKRVRLQIGPATTGRTITGDFFCQFGVTGENTKKNADCSITLTPADTGALTVATAS